MESLYMGSLPLVWTEYPALSCPQVFGVSTWQGCKVVMVVANLPWHWPSPSPNNKVRGHSGVEEWPNNAKPFLELSGWMLKNLVSEISCK